MNIFKAMASVFYPNNCMGCGTVLADEEYFCDYCYEMIEHCAMDKICRKCGLSKKQCQCSKFIFHFDACVAPLKNDGLAKKAMHKFKFRHKSHYGKYFAEQMALAVKQRFYNREFDLIVYVPMTKIRMIQRGYNQCFVLASELSKILNIPIGIDVLGCNRKNNVQHKLSERERFNNIKGKYFCNISLSGKRILLVDDIKTTGATFDECAKQLMASGADSVCCVSALITYKDKKKVRK